MEGDESVVIDVCEEAHDKLAVHTVGHAAVPRDRIAEVLDFEGAFKARGEEATKGCDEGGESRENKSVELDWRYRDAECRVRRQEEELRKLECAWEENGVGLAGETGEDVCAQVRHRADEILGLG